MKKQLLLLVSLLLPLISGCGSQVSEEPTTEPTFAPTEEPTAEPTAETTVELTVEQTVEPTIEQTVEPTIEPTPSITEEPTVEVTDNPIEIISFEVDLSDVSSVTLLRYNDRKSLNDYKDEVIELFDDLTFTNEYDLIDNFSYFDTFSLYFGANIVYKVNRQNQVLYVKDGANYYSSIDPSVNYDINSLFLINLDLFKALTDEIINLEFDENINSLMVFRSYSDSMMSPCSNKELVDKTVDLLSKLELYKLDMSKLSNEEKSNINTTYMYALMKCYNIRFKNFTINIALDFSVYVEIDGISYYGKLTEEEYALISYIYYL